MRWKGIIFLVVLIGIFVALSFILTDDWLERQLENIGTSVVGAKVEIDNLDFSLTGLHLRWSRLQVTNPKDTWKNIIETGKTECNFELLPLFSKKVVIENMQLSDLQTGTERATDGKIIKKAKKKKETKPKKPGFFAKTTEKLQKEVETAPAWNLDQ